MRNLEIEDTLLQLDFKIQSAQIKLTKPSESVLILAGLATKCRSHCHMARELIISDALAESVIVLRAAYEAAILALYLQQNPNKIQRYLIYSALTTLRNQLELLEILGRDGNVIPGEAEQRKYISNQKQTIVLSGILSEFKLIPEDLDDWQKIKKYTNNAHFMKFEDLRTNIIKDETTKTLFETGFQVYNLGSQMAHSNFDMVNVMIYRNAPHPLYGEHAMYRQILSLLNASAKTLHFCKIISNEDRNQIFDLCLAVGLELNSAN